MNPDSPRFREEIGLGMARLSVLDGGCELTESEKQQLLNDAMLSAEIERDRINRSRGSNLLWPGDWDRLRKQLYKQ